MKSCKLKIILGWSKSFSMGENYFLIEVTVAVVEAVGAVIVGEAIGVVVVVAEVVAVVGSEVLVVSVERILGLSFGFSFSFSLAKMTEGIVPVVVGAISGAGEAISVVVVAVVEAVGLVHLVLQLVENLGISLGFSFSFSLAKDAPMTVTKVVLGSGVVVSVVVVAVVVAVGLVHLPLVEWGQSVDPRLGISLRFSFRLSFSFSLAKMTVSKVVGPGLVVISVVVVAAEVEAVVGLIHLPVVETELGIGLRFGLGQSRKDKARYKNQEFHFQS